MISLLLRLLFAAASLHAANNGLLELPLTQYYAYQDLWNRDPASACRRPGAYAYLHDLGRINGPPLTTACPQHTVLAADLDELTLVPERIYEVQYVIAGRGAGLASQFGHTLLRFIVCAPERKTVGPDCRNDEFYALDLGFAAQTDTQRFSLIGGITGKYPSLLSFDYDLDLRRHYLKDELRDMTAYPLKLTPEVKATLIAIVAERFWSHDRRYQYFNRNCAGEVLEMLKAALPNGSALSKVSLNLLSPKELLEELVDHGLTTGETFEYPSVRVDIVRQLATLPLPPGSIDDYLRVAARLRRAWFTSIPADRRYLFVTLESLALQQANTRLTRVALKQLRKKNQSLACGVDVETLRADIERASSAVNPQLMKRADTYDVPRSDQILPLQERRARKLAVNTTLIRVRECFKDVPELKRAAREAEDSHANVRELIQHVLRP